MGRSIRLNFRILNMKYWLLIMSFIILTSAYSIYAIEPSEEVVCCWDIKAGKEPGFESCKAKELDCVTILRQWERDFFFKRGG